MVCRTYRSEQQDAPDASAAASRRSILLKMLRRAVLAAKRERDAAAASAAAAAESRRDGIEGLYMCVGCCVFAPKGRLAATGTEEVPVSRAAFPVAGMRLPAPGGSEQIPKLSFRKGHGSLPLTAVRVVSVLRHPVDGDVGSGGRGGITAAQTHMFARPSWPRRAEAAAVCPVWRCLGRR